MRKLLLIIRWFIFYPIILPFVIIFSIPILTIVIPWTWIERKRYLRYTGYTKSRERIKRSKSLKKFTVIITKPFLLLASIDEIFNID